MIPPSVSVRRLPLPVLAAWLAAAVMALPFAVAAAAGDPEWRGALTSEGSFWVEWRAEPERIPLNELFEIRFRVLDPGDRRTPVQGAVVTASAWMPAHNHGTTLEPRVESAGDGTATAHGFLLHMEGEWELRVAVASGGRMERAAFDIRLEP